jgi:hypothetical protein
MHTFSISTIDTFFATGIFGRRSSRITDRRFQLLPDITDGPLPMVQHGTVCRPSKFFWPYAAYGLRTNRSCAQRRKWVVL